MAKLTSIVLGILACATFFLPDMALAGPKAKPKPKPYNLTITKSENVGLQVYSQFTEGCLEKTLQVYTADYDGVEIINRQSWEGSYLSVTAKVVDTCSDATVLDIQESIDLDSFDFEVAWDLTYGFLRKNFNATDKVTGLPVPAAIDIIVRPNGEQILGDVSQQWRNISRSWISNDRTTYVNQPASVEGFVEIGPASFLWDGGTYGYLTQSQGTNQYRWR